MAGVALVLAALGVLGAVVFLIVVPGVIVRGAGLALTVICTAVAGNNSVPRSVWVPVYAFCALVLCIGLARVPRTRPIGRTAFPLLGCWWGFLAVGILVNGSYSLPRMAAYFGLAVLMTFVTTQLTRRELNVLLIGVLLTAVGESVYAGAEIAFHLTPLWGYRGDYVRTNPLLGDRVARAQGTMGQPIILGFICGAAAIIAWANRVGMRNDVRLLVFAVSTCGIVLSGTRSVVLALTIAIAAHLLMRNRLASWLRNTMIAAAAAGIVGILNFGVTRLANDLVSSGSFEHRMGSILSVPRLLTRPLAESLWGGGFGSEVSLFTKGYITTTYDLRVVDDFVVYLLGTTGIIGLALFTVVVIRAFLRADRQARSLIIFMVVMFFSFDVAVWTFTGLVLTMFLALPPDRVGVRGALDETMGVARRWRDGTPVRSIGTPATPRRLRPRPTRDVLGEPAWERHSPEAPPQALP